MGRLPEKGWEKVDSHLIIAELVEKNMIFFFLFYHVSCLLIILDSLTPGVSSLSFELLLDESLHTQRPYHVASIDVLGFYEEDLQEFLGLATGLKFSSILKLSVEFG